MNSSLYSFLTMSPIAMRQLEERQVPTKIDLMVWSTKMDVLALSYITGVVALHRLNWLKVWTLLPPVEGVSVKGMAWRPDGKVIAIGYSNAEILLVDVENKDILNKTTLDGEITSMTWSHDKEETPSKCRGYSSGAKLNQRTRQLESRTKDECNVFLPKLPSLSRSFGPSTAHATSEEYIEDAKRIKDQASLNLLIVGLRNGKVYVSVFGLFPCAVIDVSSFVDCSECVILDSNVSSDFRIIFVVVSLKTNDNDYSTISVLLLNSEVLSANYRELHSLAVKYGHVTSAVHYLNQTLLNITESWENILIEMDSKLTDYASKVPQGRVSADFLELLMFGTPSTEMEVFLLHDLTERGLKKLGNSIEMSYLNIQKLVLKHLHSVGQNLSYHLDELCGLSRCPSYNRALGLDEKLANGAFNASGAFLIKSTEVQQVIDDSLTKYKTFFRWLYATIIRLSDDRVPPEVSKTSQQDLQDIAEFLYNFEGHGDGKNKTKFNLEKLGQYLEDKPLETLSSCCNDYWTEFLEKKYPQLNGHPAIIPHHREMSLIQEIKHLQQQIQAVFRHSEQLIGKKFKLEHAENVLVSEKPDIKLTNIYVNEGERFVCAIVNSKSPANGFHLIETPIKQQMAAKDSNCKCIHLSMDVSDQKYRIIDVQFYLPDVLSVLIETKSDTTQSGIVQLPVTGLKDLHREMGFSVSLDHVMENHTRQIEGITALSFAVSGSRKVSVVLSENRKKVKLYEMEVEDEDEEEEAMEATCSSINDTDKHMDDSIKL